LLKAAWEKGITTWDTANSYSHGESERVIGKAIKRVPFHFFNCLCISLVVTIDWQLNIPRHRITILTKCFGIVHDNIGVGFIQPHMKHLRDYVNQRGLSRQAIFNAVDASLERLDTSYIDLLQIHRGNLDEVTAEETMKALHDLVQSGKVRYIGASSMWTWQFAHYNHVAEKVWIMLNAYTSR
jgi:aryl-alcohol dehydrogenase-like predicted oxidoreductase